MGTIRNCISARWLFFVTPSTYSRGRFRTFHHAGASRSWWTNFGGVFGRTSFRSASRKAPSAMLNTTAFVVPWLEPRGMRRHNDVAIAVGTSPRCAASRATSSTRSWNAKWAFGRPGITRSSTWPPWQEKQLMDQRPRSSTTYCNGFSRARPGAA